MTARSDTPQAGFTIIEVLVALVILGLVLGASYQLFDTGLKSVARMDRLARAAIVAKSVMAAVGPRVTSASDGLGDVTEDGLRWSVRVSPYEAGVAPRQAVLALYRVTVLVSWDSGGDYRLSTLAVGPPP